uniref:G-protein coupled receptors family 1 profile domain-containing protein n=1 Tax=Ditylenchus dipsaci TaxID=166011 RepID=A0A915CUN4_9BILA
MQSAFTDLPAANVSAAEAASAKEGSSEVRVDDVVVFIALESLGTLAITGNMCLIIVLLRNKYLHRASFILMLSLAIADVLHGIVTTSFFYPPIILKSIPIHPLGVRAFNVIDWTAWSITLTHMSAICLDRLVAIMLYGRYNMIMTVRRVRRFTVFCWSTFFALNTAYILLKFCCLIAPLRSNQFYTFGYGEFESQEEREANWLGPRNVFTFTYTPLELTTIAILSISNPITLVQLYRRHKRKLALRMASTMLLEMSMRMGSKAISNDVRELASRRSNRQQQRILLQISVIAVIFYLYMSTYYLLYHVFLIENKWVVLFNSFFYSTTHMINPVIYFSLNKEMRLQLTRAFSDFLNYVCCTGAKQDYYHYGSVRKTSAEQKSPPKTCRSRSHESRTSTCRVENSFVGATVATENSPLILPSSTAPVPATNTFSFNFRSQVPKSVSTAILKEVLTHELAKIISTDPDPQDDCKSILLPATTLQEDYLQEQQLKQWTEQPVIYNLNQKNTTSESIIIDLAEPLEKLELDLVSSCSLANDLSRTVSTHSCGLARKLEEHANSFIEAENMAINKAREQRTSLLDSLIRALSLYPEEGEQDQGDVAMIDEVKGTQASSPDAIAPLCYEAPSSSSKYSKSMELSKLNGCVPNTLSIRLPSPILQNDVIVGSMAPELVNGGLHKCCLESGCVHRGRSSSNTQEYFSQLVHSHLTGGGNRGAAFSKITSSKLRDSLLLLMDQASCSSTNNLANHQDILIEKEDEETEEEMDEEVVFL